MGHVASGFASSGSSFPISVSLNFGSNAGRWCVIHVYNTAGLTPTGVTMDGVALTERASGATMSGGTSKVYEGSVTGTGSLTVEATGTGSGLAWFSASAYDGVSGYRASSAVIKVSTSSADNIAPTNVTTGDFVWGGGNDYVAGATYAGAGGTTLLGGGTGQFTVGETAASSGSVDLEFTMLSTVTWSGGALALVPTGGGGGGGTSDVLRRAFPRFILNH